MTEKKITVPDVLKKDLKLFGYLIVSGGLGYVLAVYVAENPMLTAIFTPAINYILYRVSQELDKEGYVKALS